MGTKISDLATRGRYSGDPSSSGNNTLVSGVSGKRIVVTSYFIKSSGTVNAKFLDNSTQISGTHYEIANTGVCATYNPEGWFETSPGNPLVLNLSTSQAVGVTLNYVLVG